MTQTKQTDKNGNLEPYRSKQMELNDRSLCQAKDNIIKLISLETQKIDFREDHYWYTLFGKKRLLHSYVPPSLLHFEGINLFDFYTQLLYA